jgi:hypothetical protein
VTRRTTVVPAWNCEAGQCGVTDCPGLPRGDGGSHGNRSEVWVFALGDEHTTVSISLVTGRVHPSTGRADHAPGVVQFVLHFRPGLIPYRRTDYCDVLPGGRCAVVESSLAWSAERWAACDIGQEDLPASPDEMPHRFWFMLSRVKAELWACVQPEGTRP